MNKSNIIPFPSKEVKTKILKEKEDRREKAIEKGIRKCVKKFRWIEHDR